MISRPEAAPEFLLGRAQPSRESRHAKHRMKIGEAPILFDSRWPFAQVSNGVQKFLNEAYMKYNISVNGLHPWGTQFSA